MDLYLGRPLTFHTTIKPAGPACNLGCSYCYYLPQWDKYGSKSVQMSDSVLETVVRQIIQSQSADSITFSWQGGEPCLAGLGFFQRAVALQKRYAHGKSIINTFQTNGTLLNADWGRFLAEEGFLVGISLDGPERVHDALRRTQGGGPSWKMVMRGLDCLLRAGVEFNTLTTVNSCNVMYPVETYDFLVGLGSQFHQYLPVARWENGVLTKDSISGAEYGYFLEKLFHHWLGRDRRRVSIQFFDDMLGRLAYDQEGLCLFNRTCGDTVSIEYDGGVFRCDHLMNAHSQAGNVGETDLSEILTDPSHLHFRYDKVRGLALECLNCEWQDVCNGGCPEHRHGDTGSYHFCAAMRKILPVIKKSLADYEIPSQGSFLHA